MADGFIVRRGGKVTQQTIAPSILDFSLVSATSIKFKLRNNDAETATLVYRFSSLTGDGESISLATNTTSSEITLTGVTLPGTLFVTANATGKIKSNVVEQLFEIVYTAATGGTTLEYDDGGKRFKSHTFTSNGTFEVTTVGDATDDRNKVDYLIIAGGGGGAGGTDGEGFGSGGGGAGGYRTTLGTSGRNSSAESKITVTATSFSVVIGLGGAGGVGGSGAKGGANGTNSSALGITSIGGGGGITFLDNTTGDGGSGGGAPEDLTASNGGNGTSAQGFDGGDNPGNYNGGGSGGGGASANGEDNVTNIAGDGGNGLDNLLRTGSNETRAGGGGGGARSGTFGSGGSGGGADGGTTSVNGSNGTANTGGGGGGSSNSRTGGNGGDGIVIIRYEIAPSV